MSRSIFDADAPAQPGQRATESAHRKIDLQSPADLTYIIGNVSQAARERIEEQIDADASSPEEKQGMKKKVEQLVDDYIRNTFSLAKDNISINGLGRQELEAELAKAQEGEELEPPTPELEPFDTKLAQRIQSLSEQIEQHTLHLANLRRRGPADTAQRFLTTYEAQSAADATRLSADHETRLAAARAVRVDGGEGEDDARLMRAGQVQENWERGAKDLAGLKTGLGGTVVRLERAREAVGVVEER